MIARATTIDLDAKVARLHYEKVLPRLPCSFTLGEFLALQIPPREMMLGPIIAERSINMIFAPRGVGKTRLAYAIAAALATGTTFLKWKAERPRRVLIVDGELPGAVLQERLREAIADIDNRSYAETHISIVPSDLFERGLPDLATTEGQEILNRLIGDAELIIFDNVSTLIRSGKENEAESWGVLQEWLLALRRAGRSTLLIHHAGRNGESRGTSKREDIMDTIIRLNNPSDYLPSEGTRFTMEFTKSRSVMGADVESLEVSLNAGKWSWRPITDVRADRIIALKSEGLTQREIATEVGTSLGTVNRTLKAAKDGAA